MADRTTPSEYKAALEEAEITKARLGVNDSDYGPGYLEITKTTFKDGGSFIYPAFFPNSAKTYKDKKTGEIHKFSENVTAPKGGFVDGNHAIKTIRDRFGIVFKVKKFNDL